MDIDSNAGKLLVDLDKKDLIEIIMALEKRVDELTPKRKAPIIIKPYA